MKLFVDDARPAPKKWVLARDVESAIRMIATSPESIEAISLDRDAGTEVRGGDATFSAGRLFRP